MIAVLFSDESNFSDVLVDILHPHRVKQDAG